jgi:transcriptional regulator with XRE-family HTH domain
MATIGERVKHERERRRFSQMELATVAGISQGLLSRLEAGKISAPNSDVIKRLARALWVTTDYLLCMDTKDEGIPADETLVGAVDSPAGYA